MIDIGVVPATGLAGRLAVVGLAVVAGEVGPKVMAAGLDGLAGVPLPVDLDAAWGKRAGFTAKPGQVLVLRDAALGSTVVLAGLGDAATVDADHWRRWAASIVRASGEGGVAALVVPAALVSDVSEPIGAALAEGALLAGYRFDQFKTSPRPGPVDQVAVIWAGSDDGDGDGPRAALEQGVARGAAGARAALWARDLINTPPSDLTPIVMAARVRAELADVPGVTVEVWDEARIADERLGGLLGVARGSAEPPRFIRADYVPTAIGTPAERVAHVVLVGKGITFDSGGLSLKTPDGMTAMKTDMSGAAIVLAALRACAETGVPVAVTALTPLTENMPGGAAVKPGDVLRMRNGATVEVLNTDAEGRLVLADALCLAVEEEPDAIVDVATLTGAAAVALGPWVAPLYGTDQSLIDALVEAGRRAGERLWPMPMPEDYGEFIESDVADMKNIGRAGHAASITAAMVLSRFAGEIPWCHLDIANTGRSAESSGILSKGGTAFGVRLLVEFLRSFGASGS